MMKKWKEKFIYIIFGASALGIATNTLNAQAWDSCQELSCDKLCGNTYKVGVEFLYWKSCIDDLNFAYSFNSDNWDTEIRYKDFCPNWEPGIRAFAAVSNVCGGWDAGVSYTYLGSDTSSTFSDSGKSGISSSLLHPGIIAELDDSSGGQFTDAAGDWRLHYHDWDILFAHDILCNRCHQFLPFFGIAGVYIDQKLKVELTNPTGVNFDDSAWVKWDSKYWGVGLRVGSQYKYSFNECVSIFARAEGTLLAGEASSKNMQEVTDAHGSEVVITRAEFKDSSCCHFLPGYGLSSGFLFNTCICNLELLARIGYEFVEWSNLSNQRIFSGKNLTTEAAQSSSPSTRTLGFHGLFAGLQLFY